MTRLDDIEKSLAELPDGPLNLLQASVFIVEARTHIPWLVAEVKRLEAEKTSLVNTASAAIARGDALAARVERAAVILENVTPCAVCELSSLRARALAALASPEEASHE